MKYLIQGNYHCKGTTTINHEVEANSEEEAMELFHNGEGSFVDEVPDIQIVGDALSETIIDQYE